MTDPTTTPTPAETRQDTRMVVDHGEAWEAVEANSFLSHEAKCEVHTILDDLAKPLAAVSAAAPDEREALVDAVVDRMRWAYSRPGDPMEPARLRRQAEEVVDLLAARPAPTVVAPLVGRGGLTGTEFVITAWHIEDGRVVADEKVTADEYAESHRPTPVVSGKARTPDESCISGAAEHAGAAADDEGGQE